ncbi:MAG: hypothetical protein WCI51_00120 [Lentisphaerota bacterium]
MASQYGYDGVELRRKYAFDDLDQTSYQLEVAALKAHYPTMEVVFGGAIDFCSGKKDEVEKTPANICTFLNGILAAKEDMEYMRSLKEYFNT